jgi:hypothetical protein
VDLLVGNPTGVEQDSQALAATVLDLFPAVHGKLVHLEDRFEFTLAAADMRLPVALPISRANCWVRSGSKRIGSADPPPRIGAHLLKASSTSTGTEDRGPQYRAELGASDLQATPRSEGNRRLWNACIRWQAGGQGGSPGWVVQGTRLTWSGTAVDGSQAGVRVPHHADGDGAQQQPRVEACRRPDPLPSWRERTAWKPPPTASPRPTWHCGGAQRPCSLGGLEGRAGRASPRPRPGLAGSPDHGAGKLAATGCRIGILLDDHECQAA